MEKKKTGFVALFTAAGVALLAAILPQKALATDPHGTPCTDGRSSKVGKLQCNADDKGHFVTYYNEKMNMKVKIAKCANKFEEVDSYPVGQGITAPDGRKYFCGPSFQKLGM